MMCDCRHGRESLRAGVEDRNAISRPHPDTALVIGEHCCDNCVGQTISYAIPSCAAFPPTRDQRITRCCRILLKPHVTIAILDGASECGERQHLPRDPIESKDM